MNGCRGVVLLTLVVFPGGGEKSLGDYKGKVVLIENVASL